MLVQGYSLDAILGSLEPLNATLGRSRVTADSLWKHRTRHFNIQVGASAVWRRLVEERQAVGYDNAVTTAVTSRALLEAVQTKGFATVIDPDTHITVEQALAASRELTKMAAVYDQEQRWAEVHAKQAKIVAVFREFIPPERHQEFMDRLDGKTPPPPGGARLALDEATPAEDTEREPFGVDDEDDDFEDDDDY